MNFLYDDRKKKDEANKFIAITKNIKLINYLSYKKGRIFFLNLAHKKRVLNYMYRKKTVKYRFFSRKHGKKIFVEHKIIFVEVGVQLSEYLS